MAKEDAALGMRERRGIRHSPFGIRKRRPDETVERSLEALQRDLKAFQRDPEAFQRDPEAFQRDLEAFQRDPEAFQRDLEAFQRGLEAFQRDLEELRQAANNLRRRVATRFHAPSARRAGVCSARSSHKRDGLARGLSPRPPHRSEPSAFAFFGRRNRDVAVWPSIQPPAPNEA